VAVAQPFVGRRRHLRDDAERSKPDPDILVAALEKSGSSPDRAIMIGDTPYDVEAASRAGLATIAFRCGGWDDARLQGAIAIYDDPRALLDRLGQSPLRRERIDPGTDKRFVRRGAAGKFKESDDVGKSLAGDRRKKARTKVKSGQGDR
jgi:Haloacid dehalogenase-like hydrolase